MEEDADFSLPLELFYTIVTNLLFEIVSFSLCVTLAYYKSKIGFATFGHFLK